MSHKDLFIKSFLGHFPFDLPEDEISEFCSMFKEKSFSKGENISHHHEKNDLIAFISQGLVRFYFNTFDGKEFNQTFKKENHLIADHYSILTGKPAIFSIQALEDTFLYVANYQELKKLFEKHRHWDRLGRMILEENFVIKSERENELLTMNAEDRYECFCKKFKDYGTRISQKDIALYVGVNPSTLNRMIKKG